MRRDSTIQVLTVGPLYVTSVMSAAVLALEAVPTGGNGSLAQSSASGEPVTLLQRRDEFSVFVILKLQCKMSYFVSLMYANS